MPAETRCSRWDEGNAVLASHLSNAVPQRETQKSTKPPVKTPQNLTFIIETLYEVVVFIQARIIATASSYNGTELTDSATLMVGGGEKVTLFRRFLGTLLLQKELDVCF